ncbi:MAG: class I SAM-dependent methyltransferase [Rhodospirillaceae bacterium]|nr:class I SAM-dependent methyltransferase [Rhodospirillaceae bacterium]
MTAGKSHGALVGGQFGPRAAAYVTSTVHAQGEDLQQLAALAKGRAGGRALDLGCGGGHVSFAVAPHLGEVVAYDLSEEMLAAVAATAAARGLANIRTQAGRVEALPFADAGFDLVLTRFSAHHWDDLDAALAEARRVLRPDGRAAFADGVSPGPPLLDTFLQAIELLRDPSHVRNYSVEEWRQALTRAGFRPGAVTRRRVRLEFATWIARMATPEPHVAAIRSLQARMPEEVARHFAVEPDGSFLLDTMVMEATPA